MDGTSRRMPLEITLDARTCRSSFHVNSHSAPEGENTLTSGFREAR